jgi:hypothetical protein
MFDFRHLMKNGLQGLVVEGIPTSIVAVDGRKDAKFPHRNLPLKSALCKRLFEQKIEAAEAGSDPVSRGCGSQDGVG